MNINRKRVAYVVIGGLLFAVCGPLIWLGYLLSWGFAVAKPVDYLKIIFHPVTVLFLIGIWLIVRGFTIRDK